VPRWNANAWGGFTRTGTALVAVLVLTAWAWDGWMRFARLGATHPDLAAPWQGAAFTLAVRVATLVIEAGFYAAVWGSIGRRLPFLPFATALTLASSLDLCASALRDLASVEPGPLRLLIGVLGGPRALEPLVDGMAAPGGALDTLGVLTAGRIALTAWAQAHGLRRGLLAPLVLTAATWLAFRFGLAWYTDLARGVGSGAVR
jgi:hypothetical protein